MVKVIIHMCSVSRFGFSVGINCNVLNLLEGYIHTNLSFGEICLSRPIYSKKIEPIPAALFWIHVIESERPKLELMCNILSPCCRIVQWLRRQVQQCDSSWTSVLFPSRN